MKRIWIVTIIVVIIGLAVSLGWSLTRPNKAQPVTMPVIITGKVWQNSHYGGALDCLDAWDFPVTRCQVILRYAGAEGIFTQTDSQTSSPWSVYVSNGKIVDQVQVDEDGVYFFKLDWEPEGAFTGNINQEVIAVLYQVEIMTTIQGFCDQTVIGSNQIRITKDSEVIHVSPILLSR